jgi:hypothetical protein
MGTVSRVHTFASGAVLTAAQLNNEFDNLLTSSAINGGLNATNLGVTAGQITASKAIVVDGSRNLDDGTTSNQINNLVLSGTLTVAGATTQTGALSIDDTTDSTSTTTGSIHTDGGVGIAKDLIVGDDVKLLTDSAVLSLGVGSDATLTHDGTTGLTIAANPVIVDSGDALTLDAHTGIHIFKDAGTEVLRFTEGNSGDVTIKLATNGKDLIFTDHGDATGLKVLDAAAGINVPGEVQTTKIAYTDGDDALTIADGGGVTTSGTFESGGAATLASLVCTAAGTFGGGYGATGATISTAGVIQANGAITSDGAVTGATLAGTVSTAAQNSITSASSLATVGTITSGTWQGTKVASAYLDDQTAHLNITQSFTGAKTFGAATQFNSTVTVGVDDTGYDVQLFGATSGSNILWDQSADDLIFTNAGIAVGSDATGDIYYRDASGFLARLGASTDGHVLTTGGAGTIPAWEALPGGGTFSGPGSSTDNAVVRFNGTGGATGQNSGVIIDDSNNVTGAANVTLSGELDAATGDFSGIIDVAGAATLASLVCTAGGTFGGGYGSTGATISTAGVGQFNGALTTDGVFTAASLDISGDADIDGTLETDALTIGGTALLANDTNNRVTTATGSGTFNGEANLTFDGSTLGVSGVIAGTGDLTITQGTDTTTGSDPIAVFERTGSSQTGLSLKSNNIHGLILRADSAGLGAIHSKDDLAFYTGSVPGSTYGDVRMRIDAATGRVGIGTTSPSGKVHIQSASSGGSVHANVDELVVEGSGASGIQILSGSSAGGGIFFGDDGSNVAGSIQYDHGAPDSMFFYTAAAATPAMTITSGGLVHIGDSDAPSDYLDVSISSSGGRPARFTQKSSTGNILALEYSGVSPDNNTQMFLTASDGTANRAIIYSDGDVWTADAGTLTSDSRLKTNIVDASDKLADLMQLRVRNYEWTPEYHPTKVGEKKIGFIAQELETVFPSLISEHDIAPDNAIVEQLYGADDDTQYYVDGDEIPDGKAVGDVKAESQIPEGKAIGDVKVAAKDHEPTMRKAYKDAFTPILVKALQEVTVRLEAAEAKIANLESA